MTFTVAVGGAFATKMLSPIDGYSRKQDVTGQVENCKFRSQCDTEGGTQCRVTVGTQNVRLYDVNCTTPLNKLP